MRVNTEQKSVDIEQRDINYILPAYVRSYLFYSRNELPEKIIFPMFPSVIVQGKEIPIEYVHPLDAIAVEIAQDGASVAEVTPEEEATLDEKDDRIKGLKEELSSPQSPQAEPEEVLEPIEPGSEEAISAGAPTLDEVSPARAAFAEEEPPDVAEAVPTTPPPPAPSVDRQPKQPPGGDIGPGSALSDMQARDRRDQIRTAKDLIDEPDINEAEEKEYEKPITRDKEGKPLVSEDEKEG